MNVMRRMKEVLNEPAPTVVVNKLDSSSVNLAARPYCLNKDYMTVYH